MDPQATTDSHDCAELLEYLARHVDATLTACTPVDVGPRFGRHLRISACLTLAITEMMAGIKAFPADRDRFLGMAREVAQQIAGRTAAGQVH